MQKNNYKYRVYAGGSVVFEDEFKEYDNSIPYYDDYGEYEVPDNIEEVIQMGELGQLPIELVSHIIELEKD